MQTEESIGQTGEQRRQVQEIVLSYRRMPPEKKERVDSLFTLLDESNDIEEQREIALAIGEILVPERVGMGKCTEGVADLEEGVSQETKRKVDSYRRHVGAAIRRRRGELNMTQEELARKSGLPQPHISRLEDGQHAPTAKTIERLARALETEPNQLDILLD